MVSCNGQKPRSVKGLYDSNKKGATQAWSPLLVTVRQLQNYLADVFLKNAIAIGMAQFAEGFGFDLPNPFAGDVEDLTDFF